ncbi:AMP-dependent synthetase/ligase [Actinomyces sp. zg-332]|uniref:AMP-dependent synthetase/ligase n=1 Tax=Actinomyces sp. zg-332 TaxID=2708340 RepID=UPI001E41AFA6|nr:AMP-dependent synthetase/ligase [Actinomyces sp. zg-332]
MSKKISYWKAPEAVKTQKWMNIPWLLHRRIRKNPNGVIIERKTDLGNNWQKLTASEFGEQVTAVARGLISLGLQPGDKIAIMSRTRYEWTLLDFASWSAGLIVVPVYETSSADQIEWILTDAEISTIFVENASLQRLVQSVKSKTNLKNIFCIENHDLETLRDQGRLIPRQEVTKRCDNLTMEDIATIVYTSGTTGRPKGTILTHSNFVTLSLCGMSFIPEVVNKKRTRLLLFIPLAHVLARFCQVLTIAGPGVLGHSPDIKNLISDLGAFKPSYVLAVPRVFEKIYNTADTQATGFKQKIFRWASKVAIQYSKLTFTEKGPNFKLRVQRQIANRLVYAKLQKLLGENAEFAISGGAPLGDRLGHFYHGAGINILEGYGLTETLGPLSVNMPNKNKIGSVGSIIQGMECKVLDDGEIVVKGISVTPGYYHNEEETNKAIKDGWFHTGDLGYLDDEGYLYITGRKKDIIVTAGGKNVSPAILEDSLRGHPLISQAIIVGDGKPFISCLLTIDREMLPVWLKNKGLPLMDVSTAIHNTRVIESIEKAIERTNKSVSRAESIKKYKILINDFTIENDLLTPSMKIKRSKITQAYEKEINEIYDN